MNELVSRPIDGKAYWSIPHLPNSKLGSGDHFMQESQARIATHEKRDHHDLVIVTEKLDGSCTAVAKVDGQIHALTRTGYPAYTSPMRFLREFNTWVNMHMDKFDQILYDGERLAGEWMVLAHGMEYSMPHVPWVAFDLITKGKQGYRILKYDKFIDRVDGLFPTANLIHRGEPVPASDLMPKTSGHGAFDKPEGMVYKVERNGAVDFLAKFVRHDFIPGRLLPGVGAYDKPVWNNWVDDLFPPTMFTKGDTR